MIQTTTDDSLTAIRALIANKTRGEVVAIREDIATHIRSLGSYGGAKPREQRHLRERDYLDSLLALELPEFEAALASAKG